jgi:hypothetical protein
MLNLFYDYQVDGKPLPIPDQNVEISYADLDSEESGRDEGGFMHRIVLRERVKTWAFSYDQLDRETYSYILSLFAGKPTFTFDYRDDDGYPAKITAYCSNHSIAYRNAKTGQYANLKFTIIEC